MQTYQVHLDSGQVIVADAQDRGAAIAFVEAMTEEIAVLNPDHNPDDPKSPRTIHKTVPLHRGRTVVGVAPYRGGDPVPVWGRCAVCKGKGGGYEHTEVQMVDSFTGRVFWCCSDACHEQWLEASKRRCAVCNTRIMEERDQIHVRSFDKRERACCCSLGCVNQWGAARGGAEVEVVRAGRV